MEKLLRSLFLGFVIKKVKTDIQSWPTFQIYRNIDYLTVMFMFIICGETFMLIAKFLDVDLKYHYFKFY